MTANDTPTYVAIEAGGTKFIVAVGTSADNCVSTSIPTQDASSTIHAVKAFVTEKLAGRTAAGIGVASFGPLSLDPSRNDFGAVLPTPKPGWSGYNYRTDLMESFGAPVNLSTDVNAAALAELQLRKGCNHLAYVTVGTGIGVGVVNNGQLSNGNMHPEIGHIQLKRHEADQDFPGVCPFHGDCLEGLASGPAIAKRWGQSLSELPNDHIAHDIEATYLAGLCTNLILHHMPDVIVIGGGVSQTPQLLERIRQKCKGQLAGYLPHLDADEPMERLIVSPFKGSSSGLEGAFLLAQGAF